MQSHHFHWPIDTHLATSKITQRINHALVLGARLFIAVVPATAIVLLATWASGAEELHALMQAALWAAGFVLLALAVESGPRRIGALIVSGMALPGTAFAAQSLGADWLIGGAVVVSAWVAYGLFSRTRYPS